MQKRTFCVTFYLYALQDLESYSIILAVKGNTSTWTTLLITIMVALFLVVEIWRRKMYA